MWNSPYSISDIIKYSDSFNQFAEDTGADAETLEETEIMVKYDAYIGKEHELAKRLESLDNIALREDFNYHKLTSLSFEAREKLSRMKPGNLGQASRISGISPSDISVLLVHLGR